MEAINHRKSALAHCVSIHKALPTAVICTLTHMGLIFVAHHYTGMKIADFI